MTRWTVAMNRIFLKNPTLKNQRVGHPEKPNSPTSVDGLEWYDPIPCGGHSLNYERVCHPPGLTKGSKSMTSASDRLASLLNASTGSRPYRISKLRR